MLGKYGSNISIRGLWTVAFYILLTLIEPQSSTEPAVPVDDPDDDDDKSKKKR
jgi:hypothetical protein